MLALKVRIGKNLISCCMLCRPKLKHIQNQIKEEVKKMMSVQLRPPTNSFGRYAKSGTQQDRIVPDLVASCSTFGPQVTNLVEIIYKRRIIFVF